MKMKADHLLSVTWKPACLFQQRTTCAHTAQHVTPENKPAECRKLLDRHEHTHTNIQIHFLLSSHTHTCLLLICTSTNVFIANRHTLYLNTSSATSPSLSHTSCPFLPFIPPSFQPVCPSTMFFFSAAYFLMPPLCFPLPTVVESRLKEAILSICIYDEELYS